ncbi:hypothetical protein [Terracidiphilus sp.]|jgi:hypothetical protein|uniref:hypothetical protein n=1 Tax=Terracidiphilus sp. TaxID=1964191 RepID=UPI003C180F15
MNAGSQGLSVGQRIDEMVARMESELRGAVMYVNENVVPQVRHESIVAVRTISDKLRELADRMETKAAKGPEA